MWINWNQLIGTKKYGKEIQNKTRAKVVTVTYSLEVPTVRLWLGKFCFFFDRCMVTYGRWSLTICGCTWRFNGITFVACFSQELSWILHNTMAGRFDRILLVIWSMLHDIGIQFPHVAHLCIHVSAYPPNLGCSLEITGYSAVKPWWPLWVIEETGILLQQRETDEAS